ncbi:hepatic and glial cell adhesion molecule-like [Triplophysa dalaica]|uniref:hepatic and glial cell adhesion molecule-like n=1 Tax=Triplophysa dalaica TaxID=1582913 RepID=UPI0024DFCF33|nr:hepatic and glial cell adhesion molecule-like [Triplophysa dalaica]
MRIIIFLGSFSLIVNGVGFGDSDEVKSVSAMEGESVTLDTYIVKQTDDLIVWTYGPNKTIVAIINGKASSFRLSEDDRFRLGVNLNNQTGDLTISDVRTDHTGLYSLKISSNSTPSYKNFNLTVYTRLPVPSITNSSSSERSLSSKCVLLCSVMNVSHDVSVSWYKGKSLLSSISVSEHSIIRSISLHLECLDDSDVYSCVINNSISTQTQHLNTDVCHKCSDSPAMRGFIIKSIVLPVFFLIIIICVCIHNRRGAKDTKDYHHLTTNDHQGPV